MSRTRRPRSRRLVVMAGLCLIFVPAACSDNLGATPEPSCPAATPGAIAFHDGKGSCVGDRTLRLFPCENGIAPLLVRDVGTHPRRYLGPPYAVRTGALPEDVQEIGRRGGMRIFTTPRGDPRLWVEEDGVLWRWLAVPNGIGRPPRLIIIGDSIADGAAGALQAGLADWTLSIDAYPGRGTAEGAGIAERRSIENPDAVVIELGTNDRSADTFSSAATRILSTTRHVPLVLWQDVKGPQGVVLEPEVNAAIRRLTAPLPNTAIARWSNFATGDRLSGDGIHPASDRRGLMAELVVPMLEGWRRVANRPDEPCPARPRPFQET